jgi:hypothetical protein
MAQKLQVTAKVPANKEKGTPELGPCPIEVTTGATAAEMIQMFGDEAVKSNADANWVVTLQGNIRSGLKKGETPEQIQARLRDAKMGVSVKGVSVDPVQAYLARFQSATPEEQKKMLAELQKRAAAK